MKKQRGFTLFEFAFVLALIIGVGISGTVIYAAIHFISKFW